jgi:hypothetical protein
MEMQCRVERKNTTNKWGQDWGWHERRDVVKVQQKIQVRCRSWDRIRFFEALAALVGLASSSELDVWFVWGLL